MLLELLTAVEAANLPSYLLLTATNDHHFIPLHLSSVKTSCNKGTRRSQNSTSIPEKEAKT